MPVRETLITTGSTFYLTGLAGGEGWDLESLFLSLSLKTSRPFPAIMYDSLTGSLAFSFVPTHAQPEDFFYNGRRASYPYSKEDF